MHARQRRKIRAIRPRQRPLQAHELGFTRDATEARELPKTLQQSAHNCLKYEPTREGKDPAVY